MIKHVLVFLNGMVAVFDEKGEQLPEYQGRWNEKKDAIMRDKPAGVEVQKQQWQ